MAAYGLIQKTHFVNLKFVNEKGNDLWNKFMLQSVALKKKAVPVLIPL